MFPPPIGTNMTGRLLAHRCEVPGCGKRFTVLSNMRRHMKSHGYKRPSESNPGPSSAGRYEFDEPVVAEVRQIAGVTPTPPLRWVSNQHGPTTRQSDDRMSSGLDSPPRSDNSPQAGPSSGIHPAGPSSTKIEDYDYSYQCPRVGHFASDGFLFPDLCSNISSSNIRCTPDLHGCWPILF